MARVKQKVSGRFRIVALAEAYCRNSSQFQTMPALGCNQLAAAAIALQGKAAGHLDQHVR